MKEKMTLTPDHNTHANDDEDVCLVRNAKHKMPPSIHDHHMRNAFHREFNPDSILTLEKHL